MSEATRVVHDLAGPCWIFAAHQTGARGRRGRAWSMPLGNFSASLVLPNAGSPAEMGLRSFVASLALYDAVRAVAGPSANLSLKWPNDVLVQERKLAGILGQSGGDYLVIGIGLNLSEVEIENSISLSELAVTTDYDLQLSSILENFSKLRQVFETSGVSAVLDDLKSLSHTLGKKIRVTTEQGQYEGIATDIDSQGRLVLDHGDKTISAGDIMHLRGAVD